MAGYWRVVHGGHGAAGSPPVGDAYPPAAQAEAWGTAAPPGGGPACRFGVVMPMRDTRREREFAKQSIPSAIVLRPTEMVVGIDDDPGADELEDYILSIGGGFKGLRVVRVPRSDGWQFSLANVIWNCYKSCRCDAVLAFDVDTVLRPVVLKGRNFVGRDNVAVVSFTKRLLCRTAGDYVRYITYRTKIWRSSYVFAGTYWVWLPYYFDAVDRGGLSKIANGIDTYMIHAINRDGRYSIITLKDIGVRCLDYENEYYPWKQYSDGVYLAANWPNSVVWRVLGVAHMMVHAVTYNSWWVWRGYRWGRSNYDSDACRAARKVTDVNEWGMQGGSRYFADMNWERQGTGYVCER